MYEKANLTEKLTGFDEYWAPRIVRERKVVRVDGEYAVLRQKTRTACTGKLTLRLVQQRGQVEVFRLYVETHPDDWNAYDSLGEAYVNSGKMDLAIESYEKSLKLNPRNTNGAAMLRSLREKN